MAQQDKERISGSGANTPREGESTFSNVVDIQATNAEKAKILRRHLVSAEARANGGGSPGNATPGASGVSLRESPDVEEGASGSGVSVHGDENFPIPYDAPGGDVT